jgi:hypothetical protein
MSIQRRFPRILAFILISLFLISLPGIRVFGTPLFTIWFVKTTGSGTACSPHSPCTLQTALSNAVAGDSIILSAGNYTRFIGNEVILLTKTLGIIGGWDGIDRPSPIIDPDTYITTIDGEDQHRVITISGDTNQSLITGLTITNGKADGLKADCITGTGYSTQGCGGGIFSYQSEPTITHNIIHDNVALEYSGTLNASGGGGIYMRDSDGGQISDNTFYHNVGSAVDNGVGGAIALVECTGNTVIQKNDIYDNDSSGLEGATVNEGSAIYLYQSSSLIEGNFIHGNSLDTPDRVTIYFRESNPIISSNRLLNNNAGSIIVGTYSYGSILKNVIYNPDYNISAGLQLFFMNSGTVTKVNNNIIAGVNWPVAFYASESYPITATLYHNTVDNGVTGISLNGPIYASIKWNIISNNGDGLKHVNPGGLVIVDSNLFFNNDTVSNPGTNPLYADPQFIDPTHGDFHIAATSTARDQTGDSTLTDDFEDDPRPMGNGITPYDLGADEFWWKTMLPFINKP